MKISKLPLRIEPGLVALLCAWFYFDPAGTFLPFVCAAALHEAGHLAMLLWLRQPVHSLCLGLQGAVLRTGPLRYRDELLAAAAGPAMNLALLLAFSRTLPRFALVNFCLLAYNLLPFYPLDGGRLLRAVLRTLLPLRAAVWAERGVCLLCGALLLACAGYLTLCWHAGPWPLLVCLLIGFAVLVAFLKKRQRTTAAALAISIVLLYAGQTAYQMGERSVFRVTVLGQKKDAVVVIAYQGRTDVIDLTGGYRNPKYVKAWLQSEGIRTLSTLCLTKNADQMRVCYPQTMPLVSAEEAAVPSDCWLPEPVFLMGAEIYQTDLVQITDPLYTVTLADDVLQIQFGNLRFCVGTTLEKLPDGEWNAVICNRWSGGEDTVFPEQTKLVLRRQPAPEDILPPETYVQEEAVQLRVTASGEVTVTAPE